MAIELRQTLKLSQQLIMTPQLQQAIKLLQLSKLELAETIRQELEENPVLDEIHEEVNPEDLDSAQLSQDDAINEKEVTIDESLNRDVDWENFIDEYNTPGKVNYEGEAREAPQYESFVAKKETLTDHLLWQLRMTDMTEAEKNIASLIIGNINIDGYLDYSVDDLSRVSGHPEEDILYVLNIVQNFDPIGVGARNLRECLMIQAIHYNFSSPHALQIIENHMNHLENKNYKAIAKGLSISMDEVASAVNLIKTLEPKPGREFSEEVHQYIEPDIYVYKVEDGFEIVINDEGLPRIRLNSYYKKAFSKNGKVSEQAKEYMQEKIRSASWLIKSIQQRKKTIYRVMESILKFQKDFFEKGVTQLKPMVLKDVARDIDMHESTISRVTTNKYAFTPQGIFELKYFFNSSINSVKGDAVASASVMEHIRQTIESENPKNPYSDEAISELLKAKNINIARRTVAKYREMMRILPSNKRKQP